jgi:hypothetical protein
MQSPLIRIRSASPLIPRRIRILGQWEGVVAAAGADEFTAELRSLIDPRSSSINGEFSVAEVSDSDRSLVQPGAVFYWVIGYDKSPAGQITRISEIRFRRSPEWTGRSIATVNADATEWFKAVLSDEQEATTTSG